MVAEAWAGRWFVLDQHDAGAGRGGGATSRGLVVWGVLTGVGDRTESPDRVGWGPVFGVSLS